MERISTALAVIMLTGMAAVICLPILLS